VNQEHVWEEFSALPPEAQRQVADFIAFLRARYKHPSFDQRADLIDLANEEFIGVWRDRADMEDSSQWVRDARQREWTS
jgi:hypothetical protein